METIKEIRQVKDVKAIGESDRGSYGTYDGYEVETTEQTIRLLMDMDGQCCENYGYFLTEDDPRDFIGAELIDVKLVDSELRSGSLKEGMARGHCEHSSETEVMFVNLETDKGVLQFVAYNTHNGYYSHTARIESRQVTKEDRL